MFDIHRHQCPNDCQIENGCIRKYNLLSLTFNIIIFLYKGAKDFCTNASTAKTEE